MYFLTYLTSSNRGNHCHFPTEKVHIFQPRNNQFYTESIVHLLLYAIYRHVFINSPPTPPPSKQYSISWLLCPNPSTFLLASSGIPQYPGQPIEDRPGFQDDPDVEPEAKEYDIEDYIMYRNYLNIEVPDIRKEFCRKTVFAQQSAAEQQRERERRKNTLKTTNALFKDSSSKDLVNRGSTLQLNRSKTSDTSISALKDD